MGRMIARKDWVPDHKVTHCSFPGCGKQFSFRLRRHHCRRCGLVFCSEHSQHRVNKDQLAEEQQMKEAGPLPIIPGRASSLTSSDGSSEIGQFVRVCDTCFDKLHQPVAIPEGPTTRDCLDTAYIGSTI